MVGCQALYNISGFMNLTMGIEDTAFARKNFTQLPPLSKTGPPLYSKIVRNIWHSTNPVSQQKNSIGKALWHYFTVVVVLTQNMRQKSQSEGDAKFRKLLVTLRMRSCNRDDLELMHSCVPRDGHPDIVHASMITCRNANCDLLNKVGSLRFARDKKVDLHIFYAVDTYSKCQGRQEG